MTHSRAQPALELAHVQPLREHSEMPRVRIDLLQGKSADYRREDVFVSLVEVRKENGSFGNGEAQYAPPPI